jgi:hypothetical protein
MIGENIAMPFDLITCLFRVLLCLFDIGIRHVVDEERDGRQSPRNVKLCPSEEKRDVTTYLKRNLEIPKPYTPARGATAQYYL